MRFVAHVHPASSDVLAGMGSKQEQLKSVLTDAIVELCRREAFYAEELRIEGTVCIVSDRYVRVWLGMAHSHWVR